jgi:hypothetical protein
LEIAEMVSDTYDGKLCEESEEFEKGKGEIAD